MGGVCLVVVLLVCVLFFVSVAVVVWFVCSVQCCVVVRLIVSVVCVVVLVLLLLGASIVEPRLIHYSDVGVVCAVCVSPLCVLCSSVLSGAGVCCVVRQGLSCYVDFTFMAHVVFSVHRIAVGVCVFSRGVYCACRFASVVVSIVFILFVVSVVVVLCVQCVFGSAVVKRVFIIFTG